MSPYQLRSRVPHIDQSSAYDALDPGFMHDSFDTFTDYHGEEVGLILIIVKIVFK